MPNTKFSNCLVFFFLCVIFVKISLSSLETAHSFVGHGECWCQAVGFAMGAQQLDALGTSQTWIDLRLQWVELKKGCTYRIGIKLVHWRSLKVV